MSGPGARLTFAALLAVLGTGTLPAQDTPSQPPLCDDQGPCADPAALDSASLPMTTVAASPDDYVPKPEPAPSPENPTGQSYAVGGGFVLTDHTAPWMAQIRRPERMTGITQRRLTWSERHQCSGAVIKPGWVLTAAHCLTDTLDLRGNTANIRQLNYRVWLGVKDIGKDRSGTSYRIVGIYHPQSYRAGSYSSDIALVQYAVDPETDLSRGVRASAIAVDRLPPDKRRFGNDVVHFYGWGKTERDAVSGPLLFGKAVVAPDDQCKWPSIAICGLQIAKIGIPGRQSTQCHGDSGGPLVWFSKRRVPLLIGVVSHNVGKATCGTQRTAGVFTRASAFVGWIEGVAGPLPPAPPL
ncbi:MAG TPA: serine protease [Novosphingobium sp.]|nr:serine protease [Novosphingobium sp.]